MTLRHYDVVLVGRGLGCLVAGALLARRDFSVLLLGHGGRARTYAFGSDRLARSACSLLFGQTPVWRAVLQDLAQSQTFRRRTRSTEPSFSLLLPGHRLQIAADRGASSREVRRELSEIHPVVEELWSNVARSQRAVEAELRRDKPWPPEGVVERLRARRWVPALPGSHRVAADLLDKLPHGHAYRAAAFLPAWFATDWACAVEDLPAVVAARLQHQWVNQLRSFDGGLDALDDFLVERIRAHGGIVELGEPAESLVFRRGRAAGVVSGGGDHVIGADCVISDLSSRELAELSGGRVVPSEAQRPAVLPEQGRFVVSCVLSSAALPDPLAREAFVVGDPSADLPSLHLRRVSSSRPGEELLVAECLCPLASGRRLSSLRESVLEALRRQFPFLDRHLRLVDSPHDGLPLEVWEAGRRRPLERSRLDGGSRRAESLERRFLLPEDSFLGVSGEPFRGPFRATYQVGKTVFPGLGAEGELLAAWCVARRITHADRAWQKRRRQMWSKIDTD